MNIKSFFSVYELFYPRYQTMHVYMSPVVSMSPKAVCPSSLSSSVTHDFCVMLEASWSLPTPSCTGKSG